MNYDLIDKLKSLWSRRLIKPLQRNGVPYSITELLQETGPFALASGLLLLLSFIAMLRSKKTHSGASRCFTILFGLGAILSAVVWGMFWYSLSTKAWLVIGMVALLALIFMVISCKKKSDTDKSESITAASAAASSAAHAVGDTLKATAASATAVAKSGISSFKATMEQAIADSNVEIAGVMGYENDESDAAAFVQDDEALASIKALFELKQQKIITEAEFEAKKVELLNRI
ncbi:MAG: SHOCT domain-containing protein [Clostridia bacterium]|nr:SHOCT domain-containing protein [Clostridia bacterium]